MKKIYLLIIWVLLLSTNVHAYTYLDYQNDKICGAFEVSDAQDNGKLNEVGCYSSFDAAKKAVDASTSDRRVILTKVNNKTKIVYAKYGIVDFSFNPASTTNLYEKSDLTTRKYTYINTVDTSMGIDGALADIVYVSAKKIYSAKVKIAGFTGWMNASELEIVPFPWVKATSKYTITDEIKHNYVNRPQFAYSGSAGRVIGPKPTMLAKGTYYSYDGHYFYKNLKSMLTDYKANTTKNAVNAKEPYYNYYMYLSNHTKTNYSAINIDEYIRKSYTRNVYGKSAESKTSRLYGSGTFFYNAQQVNGVNALLSYSLSRNETGNGTSSLAINKNNGFGLNAVDSNPYQAANWYPSFASSIMGYSRDWITNKYAKATHSLYFGPQFGNKAIGMNVKYASDPYWSEKMASNYYYFDKANGLQDYNYYSLGIVKKSTAAKKSASASSTTIYKYPEYEDALVIVGETKEGNTTWYKVVSDLNLDNNYKVISGAYNWNKYLYVNSADVLKINKPVSGYKNPNNVFSYKDSDYTYDLMEKDATLKPGVGKTTKETLYYYDSTLTQKTGKKLKTNRYVMIYAIAYDKAKKAVSMLVTSDYWYDQKHWVPANTISIVNSDYGLETVSTSSNAYSWVNSTTKDTKATLISGLYTNTYFPILGSKTVSGELWYKVPVDLDGSKQEFGWTLAKAPNVKITKYNYKNNIVINTNQVPTITATDKVLSQNSTYNVLSFATAKDPEDGNITSKIVVKENTIDITKLGTYKVIYQVTDSANQTVTKEIKVTVEKDHDPEITLISNIFYLNGKYDAKTNVKVTDYEDGNITSKVEVLEDNVDVSTPGEYTVKYKVTDSQNNIVEKEFTIEVKNIKNGWVEENNNTYYYVNNKLTTGFKTIDKKIYYFDSKGVLRKNKFGKINGKYYNSTVDGSLSIGWTTINGSKYYFDKKDGHGYTNYQTIDGKLYYFYQGTAKLRVGWQIDRTNYYYSDKNGIVKKGWQTIGNHKYYFSYKAPYKAYRNYQTIDGKLYYFYQGSGKLRTGWQIDRTNYYYSDKNGIVKKGWQKINGKTYYFSYKTPFKAFRGYHRINGKLYYFYPKTGALR